MRLCTCWERGGSGYECTVFKLKLMAPSMRRGHIDQLNPVISFHSHIKHIGISFSMPLLVG